ncbi:tripartite tricarboxylate transporter substrate binding protein [Metabacillus sp. KIGAM252]|uniref:Tripartite tricarboxylate transporter substrate binding protein n=1 Tax=Metabacillus flavus TaxID=2823519 RepID=A0ABS5LBN8_9BACI|nr:tripartite tricarboxylate transporter substrate-binding protein [Metabacillus flavus]MBS2968142.1 tripartite tricarboxylate transporter substrate binding protein [Metabacillus flavus]
MKRILPLSLSVSLLCSCQPAAPANEMAPAKEINLIIPAAEGGGWDVIGRSMKKVLDEKGSKSIQVANVSGGSGENGWKYVKAHPAGAITLNSSLIMTNEILGKSEITYHDFTPLAILVSDWEAIAVPKNSPYRHASEIIKNMQKNPGDMSIGLEQGFGNDDQIAFVQAAREAGINPGKIPFKLHDSLNDLIHSFDSGSIDVASLSFSEAAALHQQGKLRILAVSSHRRLKDFEAIPTWKEEGISIVFPHWRGVMGPKGMPEEEVRRWNRELKAMTETKEWKAILKKNHLSEFYKNSQQTNEFLINQQKFYETIMK